VKHAVEVFLSFYAPVAPSKPKKTQKKLRGGNRRARA
jgi:hypothetical protein